MKNLKKDFKKDLKDATTETLPYRVVLSLAYDGYDYAGWQRQDNAYTLQEEVEKSLSRLYGTDIFVLASGRTDSYVHALDQKVAYTLPINAFDIPVSHIPLAIKQFIADDIVIFHAEKRSMAFHPILDCVEKTYSYTIYNSRNENPIKRRYQVWEREPLDVLAMEEAMQYFVGTHDFTTFCSIKHESNTTIRTINKVAINSKDKEITLIFTGDGFLYHMVRIMVGTLIEVGKGKRMPKNIQQILLEKERELAGPTAPGHGLVLEKVVYTDDTLL